MKSARILYHPKPIRPTISRKSSIVCRSFVNDSEICKEELKLDVKDQRLYELATIEKEIRQRDVNILKIQRVVIRNKKPGIVSTRAPKRPKNPMARDSIFTRPSLNDIETDSSFNLNYNTPTLNK